MKIHKRIINRLRASAKNSQEFNASLSPDKYLLATQGAFALWMFDYNRRINRGDNPKQAMRRSLFWSVVFSGVVTFPENAERNKENWGHAKRILKKSREDAIVVARAKRNAKDQAHFAAQEAGLDVQDEEFEKANGLTDHQRDQYHEWGSIPGPQPEDSRPVQDRLLGYPEPVSGTVQRDRGWTPGQSGSSYPPHGRPHP